MNAANSQSVALKKAEKAGERLCAAVAAWVKALGGRAVVVGGISVQQWPDEPTLNFTVAVKVTGKKPEPKFELPKTKGKRK